MKNSISKIVSSYRGSKSLRKFSCELSQDLPVPISHQIIKNWEDAKMLPRYYTILPISMKYQDWRQRFALEILEVLKPELYKKDLPEN